MNMVIPVVFFFFTNIEIPLYYGSFTGGVGQWLINLAAWHEHISGWHLEYKGYTHRQGFRDLDIPVKHKTK